MLGMAEGGVAEERADGGEARVAGAHAVAAFLLEVVQEAADERGVEVGQVELTGLFAGAVLRVAQHQPPGVTVGGDGIGAGMGLVDQPLGEERFQGRGEVAHEPAPMPRSRRSAARASSSGTAERYQKVWAGLVCPSRVDSSGSRACTSRPSRYQPSRVCTAREWRKSGSLGRHAAERAPSPAERTRRANTYSTFWRISRVPAVGACQDVCVSESVSGV